MSSPRSPPGLPSTQPIPPAHIQIVTPSRRAISAEPPTTLRGTQRTPVSVSGRRIPLATTPHGRAAARAIDSRRAAINTPNNHSRRRSLRDLQRETPRDLLRALAGALAPKTQPIHGSSSSPSAKAEPDAESLSGFVDDDDDDDRPIRRPRLSLPIAEDDDDDDDDADLFPHRSQGLEDLDNATIELPRRAYSEQPRHSIAGGRMSDFAGGNNNDDTGNMEFEAFFPPLHAIDEDSAEHAADRTGFGEGDISYAQFDADERRATMGRESDFGIIMPPPEQGNETTFMITAPDEFDELSSERNEPFDGPFGEPDEETEEPEEPREESHVHSQPDVTRGEDDDMDVDVDNEPGEQDLLSESEAGLEAQAEESDVDMETQVETATARQDAARPKKKKKEKIKPNVRVSKHGINYKKLPSSTVKRLAQTFAKTSGVKATVSPDTLAAIEWASEWFFEQVAEDLTAFSNHAGRKTIEESDMQQLMRRQRLINSTTTPFSLAQRFLPRELLQELRMPPPPPVKRARKGKSRAVDHDDDDDDDDDSGEEIT